MLNKGIRKYIFSFFLVILFGVYSPVMADGIGDYYIEANVINNGDLHVKEVFTLGGTYNGYERVIKYQNLEASSFDGTVASFKGSDIYNGTEIELLKIGAITVDGPLSFAYLSKNIDEFSKVNYAQKGDYGYYTESKVSDGYEYLIYNPSSYKKAFYLEYIIKDLVILHNDVAELGWNLFSSDQEAIHNFEVIVNIPNNKKELRVWGHGPLTGDTEIINKEKVSLYIKNLTANTPIDIRLVFDRDILSACKKQTNLEALSLILEVEDIWADDANKKREEALALVQKQKNISYIFDVLKIILIAGVLYLIYYMYRKHDKEYPSTFKTKYFRDFPNDYAPSNVSYLINKKIGSNELSATILYLIANKQIKYDYSNKKNPKLIDNRANDVKLTSAEESLFKLLFAVVGKDGEVTIKEINKFAKKYPNKFLDAYNDWKYDAEIEAEKRNFYEDVTKPKIGVSIFCIFVIIFCLLTINYTVISFVNIITIIVFSLSLIYFLSIKKRTKDGQEEYLKWIGLKNFLNDFGQFKARELPQIELWEKYLVYAMVFGISKKLAKSMQVKFQELPESDYYIGNSLADISYLLILSDLNSVVNSSVSQAVSSAKAISESSSSSAGGFGGGFSGSGGSFGGGGGGGRF